MERRSRFIVVLVLALFMCFHAVPAMASEAPQGTLVSVEYENYPDGTSSVEKTYVQVHTAPYGLLYATPYAAYGTDTFTKTKDWHTGLGGNGSLIVSAQVTATFDWNSSTKKVKVYDAEGEVTYYAGGDITNEKTTTSGNNSRKATGKFSFKRTTDLGFSSNYSVSVSCNYKGTDS
ncbi:hypothetical protein [Clostridium sp. Marseille-P2415]|uniref:hypothetical protein n=1 Tax=Clostridium sp. Marseille-P2415 TaxID=1805471 RepID=UPI000988390D|nr:hypothetical protein [Clostridium sp. Marseille-P2415]